MRHALIAGLLYAALVIAAIAYVPDLLEEKPHKPSPSATVVTRLERKVEDLERQVELMEQTADRYRRWKKCVTWVPVNEVGDPDNRYGYGYDERDGTGPTYLSALVVVPDDPKPDYVFLQFDRRDECHSQPTQPGGTAEDASVDALDATLVASRGSFGTRVRALERRVRRLEEREEALEKMSERFDEWESCLSWVPVTEYGDADGRFGYLFGEEGAAEPGYRTAIAIDRSEWDDPDYEFLAFVGRDRPFVGRECEGEPGEGVD